VLAAGIPLCRTLFTKGNAYILLGQTSAYHAAAPCQDVCPFPSRSSYSARMEARDRLGGAGRGWKDRSPGFRSTLRSAVPLLEYVFRTDLRMRCFSGPRQTGFWHRQGEEFLLFFCSRPGLSLGGPPSGGQEVAQAASSMFHVRCVRRPSSPRPSAFPKPTLRSAVSAHSRPRLLSSRQQQQPLFFHSTRKSHFTSLCHSFRSSLHSFDLLLPSTYSVSLPCYCHHPLFPVP